MAEDEDLFCLITREQFHNIIEEDLVEIREFFRESIEQSKLKLKEVHSIEIIGGLSRTPILQTLVEDIF